MNALLHTLGAIVVVPYVALALFFLFIKEVARARGFFAIIDLLWNNVDRLTGWGIYVAPALWICLIAMGLVPNLQRASSLCLGLIAVASLLVIVTSSSTRVGVGEIIFLLPCVAVAAMSTWLFIRVGTAI